MVDRATRAQLAYICPCEVDRLEVQWGGIGGNSRHARGPCLSRPGKLLGAVVAAELKRPGIGASDCAHWQNAGGIDQPERRWHLLSKRGKPGGKRWHRQVLAYHHRGARAQAVQRGRLVCPGRQPEDVAQPLPLQRPRDVLRALQYESVVTVRVEAVATSQALVDQQR